MKKAAKAKSDSDMLDEYEFSNGIRGKHADRYAAGSNVVVLAPDVADVFPDLVRIARKSGKKAGTGKKKQAVG